MDRQKLLLALKDVQAALPSQTPKVTRTSLERIVALTEASSARSLEQLATDFARPSRPPKSKKPVRNHVVTEWLTNLRAKNQRHEFISLANELSASAKSRKANSISKDELIQIVSSYSGGKGLGGNIDSIVSKLRNSFDEKLLLAN